MKGFEIGDLVAYKESSSYSDISTGVVVSLSKRGVPTVRPTYNSVTGKVVTEDGYVTPVRTTIVNITTAMRDLKAVGHSFNHDS